MNSKEYEHHNELQHQTDYEYEHQKSYENTVNTTDPFMIKHRKRTSKKQLEVLEKTFETCIRPDSKSRKKLGDQLNMTPRAVQIWFQNRRAKIKKLNGEYKITKKKAPKKSKSVEYESYGYKDGMYQDNMGSYHENVGVYQDNGSYQEMGYKDSVYGDSQYSHYADMQYQDGTPYHNQYTSMQYDNTNEARYNNEMYGNGVPNYYDYNNENTKYPNYETMYPQYHNQQEEYYHKMYLRNNTDSRVGYPPQKYDSYYYYDENNTNGESEYVDRRKE